MTLVETLWNQLKKLVFEIVPSQSHILGAVGFLWEELESARLWHFPFPAPAWLFMGFLTFLRFMGRVGKCWSLTQSSPTSRFFVWSTWNPGSCPSPTQSGIFRASQGLAACSSPADVEVLRIGKALINLHQCCFCWTYHPHLHWCCHLLCDGLQVGCDTSRIRTFVWMLTMLTMLMMMLMVMLMLMMMVMVICQGPSCGWLVFFEAQLWQSGILIGKLINSSPVCFAWSWF